MEEKPLGGGGVGSMPLGKGRVNVQILRDDGEDLEPGVLRSKQSSTLRWKEAVYKAAKALYPKITRRKVAT